MKFLYLVILLLEGILYFSHINQHTAGSYADIKWKSQFLLPFPLPFPFKIYPCSISLKQIDVIFFVPNSYSITILTKHLERSSVLSPSFLGAVNPALSRLIVFPWKVMKLLMWSDNFAEICCNINEAKHHSGWGRLVGEGEVQFKPLAGFYSNQIDLHSLSGWMQGYLWLKNDGMWWCKFWQAQRTHLTWSAYSRKQEWSS